VIVRPERADDTAAIDAVVRAAFGDRGAVVAELVTAIRASAHAVPELALVAEEHGVVVGFGPLSWAGLTGAAVERVLMLSPLAVAPEWQRRGIGSALVAALLERADLLNAPLVIVEGDPRYYARFGFERASALGLERPYESSPDEGFQVKRLRAYDPHLRGRVVYPSAFAALY
jgi:putative acetyltransferase